MTAAQQVQLTSDSWATLTQAERERAFQDASLRINDIDWYRFHGIDPRDDQRTQGRP